MRFSGLLRSFCGPKSRGLTVARDGCFWGICYRPFLRSPKSIRSPEGGQCRLHALTADGARRFVAPSPRLEEHAIKGTRNDPDSDRAYSSEHPLSPPLISG